MVFRVSCCLQIILSSSLLAGDYFFTYSLSSEQLAISGEKLLISKAIVPLDNNIPWVFVSKIENSDPVSKNELDFVRYHKETILQEIMKHTVSVDSIQINRNEIGFEKTKIKIRPTAVRIEFNDDFVTIKIPR